MGGNPWKQISQKSFKAAECLQCVRRDEKTKICQNHIDRFLGLAWALHCPSVCVLHMHPMCVQYTYTALSEHQGENK